MARPPHESSKSWQKAMSLVVWVYKLTRKLPAEEKSGLCAAMRRSATAAVQQVADADGREDDRDASKHYEAALAALRELGTSAVICRRLHYLKARDLMALRRRIAMVEGLIEDDLETCADQDHDATLKLRDAA